MYSAYKLKKQDDTALMYSFSYLEPVCCSMSSSNLTSITYVYFLINLCFTSRFKMEVDFTIWGSNLLKKKKIENEFPNEKNINAIISSV